MGSGYAVARRWMLAALAGVAVGLAACGGGGGDPVPGGEGDPGSGYSAEQRSAATARIAEKFEELAGTGAVSAATWNALRDWVLTQPEYVDAGVGDQLLWARFSDGRYFLYTDNWRAALPPTAAVPAPEPLLAARELPASADALVLGFTGEEFAPGTATLARMSNALSARGWRVDRERALTVDALKSRGELGFLFLTSHSGIFGPQGQQQFSVMTDTQATVINEFTYADDLADGSLIYHRDRTDWQRFGFGNAPRYALTAAFVDKYLRFSPESIVIMLSCNSGADNAGFFRAALARRGAGTIVGWDGNSNGFAFRAADLLIDRLTGANAFEPATPPNRPFAMDDVWTYLEGKGLLVTPPVEGGTAAAVRRFGSGFSIAHPIISELQATGPNKLVIHGDFGSVPGTVTVGGAALTPVWDPEGKTVEVDIGTDRHGPVVVTARGRRSNTRVLASWRGQVIYTHESEEVTGCGGAKFHHIATIDLHLRADAHAMRDVVDGPLLNNARLVVPASDTRATWTADGECVVDGDVHTRWSGSGAFGFDTNIDPLSPYPPTGPLVNVLQARIDAVERRFQLQGVFGHHERYTVLSLGSTSQSGLQFDWDLAGFVNNGPDYSQLLSHGTMLPLSGSMDLAGAEHWQAHPSDPHSLRVRWMPMAVSPAHDDTIGR